MKFLPIFILCVVCLFVKGYSESIECYVCDDCLDLDDSLLEFCPPEPEEDSTETTSSEESTTSEEPTTSTEDSEPASEDESAQISEKHADPKAVSILRRTSRQANYKTSMLLQSTNDPGLSYYCYNITVKVDNEKRSQRGCIEVPENKAPCEVLKVQYGVSEKNCKACQNNMCNSSAALKYSLETFVLVIFLDLFCLFK